MLYLDTSAFLKLYLIEEGSERVQSLVEEQDDPLPLWDLLEMELTNALWLKVFWKDISSEQAENQLALINTRKRRGLYFYPEISSSNLMRIFRELTRHTQKLGCRTLDILHVSCAVLLNVEGFLSFDERQRKLADKAGLPLV